MGLETVDAFFDAAPVLVPAPDDARRAQLVELRTELRASLERPGTDALTRLSTLSDVDGAISELDERRHAAELEDLVRVHDAMARLRVHTTPQELIAAAPRELVQSLGFTRAMISRVRGSVWVPQLLEVADGIDPEAEAFRGYVRTAQIPLDHMLLETELVRRRVAALVCDPANDPRTFPEIVRASRSSSYVAAPVMPTRRVIGFLHADRFGIDGPAGTVTDRDRDLLWAFAEHFGLLFERAVMLARLQHRRSELQDALADAATAIDELWDDELELVRRGTPTATAEQRARAGRPRVEQLLTAREREVLELLASGATNAEVAEQLVVSEGTVKSHIKRIHRKLHVSNRAEAVARFLHLLRLDEGPPR